MAELNIWFLVAFPDHPPCFFLRLYDADVAVLRPENLVGPRLADALRKLRLDVRPVSNRHGGDGQPRRVACTAVWDYRAIEVDARARLCLVAQARRRTALRRLGLRVKNGFNLRFPLLLLVVLLLLGPILRRLLLKRGPGFLRPVVFLLQKFQL